MSQTSFKNFNPETDIKPIRRKALNPLFRPDNGISKPFTSVAGYTVETTTAPTYSSSIHVPITYLKRTADDTVYLSSMYGLSGSFDSADPDTIAYASFVNSVYGTRGRTDFLIPFGSNPTTSTELDIVALSREWYNDEIDLDYFSIHMYTGSANLSSSVEEYSRANGILSLYPSENNQYTSDLGFYNLLYTQDTNEVAESVVLYNTTTDAMTMLKDEQLNTSKPYGAVFPKLGVFVLFKDKIKADFATVVNDFINYIGAVVGRSAINFNTTMYFARLLADEFNASHNPTYTTDGGEIIKPEFQQNPITFVTTVGLYNERNELIATGKSSTPIVKKPDNEITFRVEMSA